MRHEFEEEFRLENPQWDFDNDITGPYIRWVESKLAEARKQLALYNVVGRSEQLPQDKFCNVCNLPTDGKKCYSKRCPI